MKRKHMVNYTPAPGPTISDLPVDRQVANQFRFGIGGISYENRTVAGYFWDNGGNEIECSGDAGTSRSASWKGLIPMSSQDTPTPSQETTEDGIPYGYCHCGCGQKTTIIKDNVRTRGLVKGEPNKYLNGHSGRHSLPSPNPSGFCMCGCGEKTNRASQTSTRDGWVEGEHMKFIFGHKKVKPIDFRHIGDNTVEFITTNGFRVLVDAEDWINVSHLRWHARAGSRTRYAMTQIDNQHFSLHRILMGEPPELEVDHINHDGLDNSRSNLRAVTPTENRQNIFLDSINATGYVGVIYSSPGRWSARIRHLGVNRHLGCFDSPEEAALAYDEAVRAFRPSTGTVNFPLPGERPVSQMAKARQIPDRVDAAVILTYTGTREVQ